ncbi:hypothetical protein J1614_007458 [Plenodomus biglobosus]|nr:hypothetical protein J1614_007458 [Plenodomus biglobosus]
MAATVREEAWCSRMFSSVYVAAQYAEQAADAIVDVMYNRTWAKDFDDADPRALTYVLSKSIPFAVIAVVAGEIARRN